MLCLVEDGPWSVTGACAPCVECPVASARAVSSLAILFIGSSSKIPLSPLFPPHCVLGRIPIFRGGSLQSLQDVARARQLAAWRYGAYGIVRPLKDSPEPLTNYKDVSFVFLEHTLLPVPRLFFPQSLYKICPFVSSPNAIAIQISSLLFFGLP